jgi:L-ascorbate 6-phosphate lactonase
MSKKMNASPEGENQCEIKMLGQVGCRVHWQGVTLYIDPYLSNSVAEKEDSVLQRLVPIVVAPEDITDADFVLITHAHRDHCDEDTLMPLSVASPGCKIICPHGVGRLIKGWGIDSSRVIEIGNDPISINQMLSLSAVPAAHPKVKRHADAGWVAIGYVLGDGNRNLYHAGDTFVDKAVIEALSAFKNIDIALIPVNEHNYYRGEDNILGNMTIREAFQFSQDLRVNTVIPTHWDMFAKNQVYKEEIELLYDKIQPDFELKIVDAGCTYAG